MHVYVWYGINYWEEILHQRQNKTPVSETVQLNPYSRN
jgi:hypothetical protein